jgi:hypothetical protein
VDCAHGTGWFACELALWRFDSGMLKTVIRADRLEPDKERLYRRARAANSWLFDGI